MAIDRKAYRADKKKYKSKVKANKEIVKTNKKIDRSNKTSAQAHKKAVKRYEKKYNKSEKVAIKKDHQERVAREKGYRRKEKRQGLEPYSIIGQPPPRMAGPRMDFAKSAEIMHFKEEKIGNKPKRSDYKGSKPQRATGSTASMRRAAGMVHKMNKRHRGM